MEIALELRQLLHRRWVGYGSALVSVALISGGISFVAGRTHIAIIVMLYLVAVLGMGAYFGSGPAILAALVSFLALDWFFVDPLYTFTIANPIEWVALLLYLLTAITTGQLAAGQRQRAESARQREREAVVLYDIVRLMGAPDFVQSLNHVAERLRQELEVTAVGIALSDDSGFSVAAVSGDAHLLKKSPVELLAQGEAPSADHRGKPGRWVRITYPHGRLPSTSSEAEHLHLVPINCQEQRVGTITLIHDPSNGEFGSADDRLLSAAAAQLGLAVERARLRRETTEAEILQRANEAKTALLNAVSHDLRTPLASILASAGALLEQEVEWSEEERRGFALTIEHEVKRLNQLVGNLLDLSRLEANNLQLEKRWYGLNVLVDEVLGRLRPLTEHHVVRTDIPENLPPLHLGYIEIDQVLSNLVENAIKYSPAGTEIVISAYLQGEEVLVTVADSGPGFPPDSIPLLFEPFYRVKRGSSAPSGTGLGLAVAKGLVGAHGGRIWAGNRPEGGAFVSFTLPLPMASNGHRATDE